jgi:hypothetical protein
MRLRVTKSFPFRTFDAQGYAYAVPGQTLDIPDAEVVQQLIDGGFGEATDPVVRIEVNAAVHRAAQVQIEPRSFTIVDPYVVRL